MFKPSLLGSLLFIVSTTAFAASDSYSRQAPENFSQTKAILKKHVDKEGDLDYYCGCPIIATGKKLTVDLQSCGYEVRKNPERAQRVEYEHTVAAFDMGRQLQCWQDGGRKNCTANDPDFARMEADPINLIPSISTYNIS